MVVTRSRRIIRLITVDRVIWGLLLVAGGIYLLAHLGADHGRRAVPIPPSSYPLPTRATYVHSSAELAAALAANTQNIVLADGVYDQTSPFSNTGGSHLYAEHVGGATLKSGLVLGGHRGPGTPVVQGLTFDVADSSRTFKGGVIHIWGSGGNAAQILDCVLHGNRVVPVGILAYNPAGLRVERVQFADFTDQGLRASDNQTVAYGGTTAHIDVIQDVSVDGVSRATPGSSYGTAEAGLWIGHPVTNGVNRIRIRNVSISGIETVNNAWDTQFTDLDIDMNGSNQTAGVGVYLEHYSRRLVFDRFSIIAPVGFTGEWADPAWGGIAAAHDVVIRNGTIDAAGAARPINTVGVYLDEGSESTTVQDVMFKNQGWAGIGAYKNIGTNTFTGNTFRLLAGAVQISTASPPNP